MGEPLACRKCGAPLRPRNSSPDEHPGTVVSGGRGLCNPDYLEAKHNGTLADWPKLPSGGRRRRPVIEPPSDGKTAENIASAVLWHRERRRNRGVRPDGSLPAYIEELICRN